MTIYLPLGALLCFAMVAAALLHSRRSRLRNTHDIIATLHPRVLRSMDKFLSLSFEDDAEFWATSGGNAGMRYRRDNARALLHLFQGLVQQQVLNADELAYLSGHANLIVLFCAVAIAEDYIRRAIPTTPHVSPRIVAILYSDLQARAKVLAEAYAPLTFCQLDAVL